MALIICSIAIIALSKCYVGKVVSYNRKGLTEDLYNFGFIAQQYYRRPVSVCGGGNSFIGWTIPSKFDTTSYGIYKATVLSQDITIIGIGNELCGGSRIVHKAIITPTAVKIVETN